MEIKNLSSIIKTFENEANRSKLLTRFDQISSDIKNIENILRRSLGSLEFKSINYMDPDDHFFSWELCARKKDGRSHNVRDMRLCINYMKDDSIVKQVFIESKIDTRMKYHSSLELLLKEILEYLNNI